MLKKNDTVHLYFGIQLLFVYVCMPWLNYVEWNMKQRGFSQILSNNNY